MLSMLAGGRGGLRQLFEVPVEARTQGTTLGAIRPGPRQHDEVPRRQRAVLAK